MKRIKSKKEKEYKNENGSIDTSSPKWADWCEKYGIASSVTYPRVKAAILGFTHTKDFKVTIKKKKSY